MNRYKMHLISIKPKLSAFLIEMTAGAVYIDVVTARVFALGEDSHSLRIESMLSELRSGNVNRHSLRIALRNQVQIHGRHLQRKNKDTHKKCAYLWR